MAIALDVALDLVTPILTVPLRDMTVFCTTVPEATIDEHRYPRRGEQNVRFAAKAGIGR